MRLSSNNWLWRYPHSSATARKARASARNASLLVNVERAVFAALVLAAFMLARLAGLALRLQLRVRILQLLLILGFALLHQIELLLQCGGIRRGRGRDGG